MYALHVAYLFWKKNRRLDEAIPLIIKQSIEGVKPKIVEFMRESLTCQQYVKTKSNKNIDGYIRQNNMSSTVWGSDVEIFSAAIWLETDIFIFIDDIWNIFSHKGFRPKKGRNIPTKLGIYT